MIMVERRIRVCNASVAVMRRFINPNIDKRRYELPVIIVVPVGPIVPLIYAFEGPNEEVVSACLPSRWISQFSIG